MSRPLPPAITRRAFGGTVAAAAVAFVSACGSSDSGSTSTGSATGGTDSFPVSIEHRFGTSTIEKAPTRVVVVGLTEQDALLALGTVPVATTKWFAEYPGDVFPWAQSKLGSATVPQTLDSTDGIQFEKVAALRPDLIVGMYSDLSQETYDTLSKIAPVLAQPKDVNDYGVSWDDVTLTVGRALGKAQQAQTVVDGVKKQFADVLAANPSFKGATASMAMNYEGYYIYGPQDPRSRFLTSLGFELPAGLVEVTGKDFGANLSKERVDMLDVDVLVWLVTDYAKDKAALKADPLYGKLDVAKEGRDVFLADGTTLYSATSFTSVLSIPYLLENLVPLMAAAIDGESSTPVEEPTTTS